MSKLSIPLKNLINSPHARPGTIPAPAHIAAVYQSIAREAEPQNVGVKAWFSAAVRSFPPLCSENPNYAGFHILIIGEDSDGCYDDHELPRISSAAAQGGGGRESIA